MFQEKISFKNSFGFTLAGILEGGSKDAPLVILCHGYDSSKDSLSNSSLAAELIKKGLLVFRFDFTGNGGSEGKLEQLTPKQGLDDLKSAVKTLGRNKFGLYGGSFGGNVAILYALENPVLALALRAPVSDYLWVVEHDEPSYRRKIWAEQLKDVDIYGEVGKIKVPVLIVHGDKDDVVPVEQSEKLFESLRCEKRLEIIKDTLHQFRGEFLKKSNTLIADFFQEHLFDK